MNKRLDGKIAIVTGASSGIGEAVAKEFARQGGTVILTARRRELLDQHAEDIRRKGGRCDAFACDVSAPRDIHALFDYVEQTYGGLDILVNNAALQLYGTAETHDEDEFDQVLACNVKGTFLCTKRAIPLMKRRGRGSIIQMGSVTGIHGHPNLIAYTASKGAIHAMTRAAAIELAKDKIRVNCVAPATIRTPILERHLAATADPEEALAQFNAIHPMGSIGEPMDVAMACVYLASDESAWVTGTTLEVDGGYLNQGQLPS